MHSAPKAPDQATGTRWRESRRRRRLLEGMWKDELQRYIEAALKLADGNLSEAARLLGVNRTTLYSKIQRLKGGTDSDV